MRRVLLVSMVLLAAANTHAYTLVLGLRDTGNGHGYRDFAAECPKSADCLTYCDIATAFRCTTCDEAPRDFYRCILRMMAEADSIVFIVDRPGGRFTPSDECDPMNAELDEFSYTAI